MVLTQIALKRFTAFDQLNLALGEGVNVFIGANGTGKTHLLKVLYAACSTSETGRNPAEKLVNLFMPFESRIGRLAQRQGKSVTSKITVTRADESTLDIQFTNHTHEASKAKLAGLDAWQQRPVQSAYIPVKEILANAPGFRSLHATRKIHFDDTYADIIDRAYLPALRGPLDGDRRKLLRQLEKAIDGKVLVEAETFFLKNADGKLEFDLLAEGHRKLALLWQLIQNGTLTSGSVLFWDEPEANLNPQLMGHVAEILLALAENGVQVFAATHNYVFLKELDLRSKGQPIHYVALHRTDESQIRTELRKNASDIEHNPIAEAYASLYERVVADALGDDK